MNAGLVVEFFLDLRFKELINFRSEQVEAKGRAKQFGDLSFYSPGTFTVIKPCWSRGA